MKAFVFSCLLFMFSYTCRAHYYAFNTRAGLPNISKILSQKNDTLKIAYLGGSITEASGYRVYFTRELQKKYPHSHIEGKNFGVGGTGSDLGVYRTQTDVIPYEPDLVFVEFAVNDSKQDSVIISKSIEGIVRKIKKQLPNTDICFLYSINKYMYDIIEQKKHTTSIDIMENICNYYSIPSINFYPELRYKLDQKIFAFHDDTDKSFTLDNTHPTTIGHEMYTEQMMKAFLTFLREKKLSNKLLRSPMNKSNYENGKLVDLSQIKHSSWSLSKPNNIAKYSIPNFFKSVMYTLNDTATIEIDFKGTLLGIYDIIGPQSGIISVSIDHNPEILISRFDPYCFYYRKHYFFLPELSYGTHHIELRMKRLYLDKNKTIHVLFPEKNISISNEYDGLFIGKFLLNGDIIN